MAPGAVPDALDASDASGASGASDALGASDASDASRVAATAEPQVAVRQVEALDLRVDSRAEELAPVAAEAVAPPEAVVEQQVAAVRSAVLAEALRLQAG